jgi:N-acetylneuraminic acid mutarotase
MKHLFNNLVIIILLFGTTIYLSSCRKETTIPVVTTTSVTDITQTTASSGGTVTDDGGAAVENRGVAWSTAHNPVVGIVYTRDGVGTGSFLSKIKGLSGNTTYYVRAFATNNAGTGYGNEVSFTSNDISIASVITTNVTAITSTTAVSGGKIPSEGGTTVTEWGVCWSTFQNPVTTDQVIRMKYDPDVDIITDTTFTDILTGLTPGTTYYVRAYAVNSVGTAYGNNVTFTTSSEHGSSSPRISDFPGGVRYDAAGFSIGTFLYVGLGYNDGDIPMKDFWEWNQATGLWTRKADYPGNSTGGAVGFSIGKKGYIGTGSNRNTNGLTNEFWEYDPANNSWIQKASISGTSGRAYAVGFSIGNKGYIGTGFLSDNILGLYSNDFWEWDQATNIWTKKADFPGNARSSAVGFSIGNKGYIGTGNNDKTSFKDFWEWDQASNVWTQKADFAGTPRLSAVGFSIGDKGYIGTGINFGTPVNFMKDFWEWDQKTNAWIQKSDFAGNARASAIGVSIGNKGYIGTGSDGNTNYAFQDFWEYAPPPM